MRSVKNHDPLSRWLSIDWIRPERSYNPDLKDFFVNLLDYPKSKIIVEDENPGGYPDIKFLDLDNHAWIVGDLKKSDDELIDIRKRALLWENKRKYVEGLTRYVIFITAHFIWILLPKGESASGFESPLDLREYDTDEIKRRLAFINYEASYHKHQWRQFIEGSFPFGYLNLTKSDVSKTLRADLTSSFNELFESSAKAFGNLQTRYAEYLRRKEEIDRNLIGKSETQQRANVSLEMEFDFVRRIFHESLPRFEEQYGREVETNGKEKERRLQEAFLSDSVAMLISRVLFLRLAEDLKLIHKRKLTNGGPKNWAAFVEHLSNDAKALIRLSSEDMAQAYKGPFEHTVFDWIQYVNGELDEALQRLILRLNAYDFSGLSEEILGDIYQNFMPRSKRKRLGEFYTPTSIVDWILGQTVKAHGLGDLLDPACGSGSFLVRYAHWRLKDAKERNLDSDVIHDEIKERVWGFDLNPFAAYISLFQITWALLLNQPDKNPHPVRVFNLNSLIRDHDLASVLGFEYLPPGTHERDEKKWRYVLGNPPYIRAERVKYGDEMKRDWS